MTIKIKEVALFVFLPIILMSFTLSLIGTEDSFAVHHATPISPVDITADSENSCDQLSCQVNNVTI